MKKTRILSILLSVCMILTCMVGLSVSASAADTIDPANLAEGDTISAGATIRVTGGTDTLVVNGEACANGEFLANADYTVVTISSTDNNDDGIDYVITLEESNDPGDDDEIDYADLAEGDTIPVGTSVVSNDAFAVVVVDLDGNEGTQSDPAQAWTAPPKEGVDHYTVVSKEDTGRVLTVKEVAAADEDPVDDDPDEDDDDDDEPKRPWAEKPEYKPSGASGTAAPEEKPAEEPKDNDKQEEPKDNDKQDEPQDKDNDTTEIPEDKDTGNDGTSTVVDGSTSTNENPHTGAALGGLTVLALAGAAMIVSKKRK